MGKQADSQTSRETLRVKHSDKENLKVIVVLL